ncbi:porin family protein [Patescibacteria group bacterium]|nr:porin family protein [Patescibacteria group bacterium]
MKSMFAVFFSMFFAVPAVAQTYSPEECKEKFCSLTPKQKCEDKNHGKWKNDACYITRIKWRKRARRPIRTTRVIEKVRIIRVPEKTIIREVSATPSISMSQRQNIEQTPPKEATAEKRWWWIGPGAFALGLYMTDERVFMTGVQGRLVFAVNDRFRVSGLAGYSFWQEQNFLLGAGLDIRLWESLFLISDFNTLWGDFDKLEVKRRYLLVGAGIGWWFGDRADISLRFIFGTKKQVTDCESPDNFVGGNMLTVNVYF